MLPGDAFPEKGCVFQQGGGFVAQHGADGLDDRINVKGVEVAVELLARTPR
jgi:hypothetical protein